MSGWSDAARKAAAAARAAHATQKVALRGQHIVHAGSGSAHMSGSEHRKEIADQLKNIRSEGRAIGSGRGDASQDRTIAANYGRQAANSTFYRNAARQSTSHTSSYHATGTHGITGPGTKKGY